MTSAVPTRKQMAMNAKIKKKKRLVYKLNGFLWRLLEKL